MEKASGETSLKQGSKKLIENGKVAHRCNILLTNW